MTRLATHAAAAAALDVERLARALHRGPAPMFHADDHGAKPDATDYREAAAIAAYAEETP
jgi:hypothetical protein